MKTQTDRQTDKQTNKMVEERWVTLWRESKEEKRMDDNEQQWHEREMGGNK